MKFALPYLLLSLSLLALSYVFAWQHRPMLAVLSFTVSAFMASLGRSARSARASNE